MDKKMIVTTAVIALVVGGIGFAGGMKYAQGKKNNFGMNGQFRSGTFSASAVAVGAGGRKGGMSVGFAGGEILSKDDKSITVKTPGGGSKIIFFSATTEVSKPTVIKTDELTTGQQVTVIGDANSDGSVSAKSIQIRPAGSDFGMPVSGATMMQIVK